ncbi:MAG: site-2 protease family protein, partial [Phycisphaerales bacterium]|nr:site-2 protease family protein [Phycisphaerales bacterium]
ALACRQVGGRADTILLWPLGGVAFVQPPPRPGAHLWSIVAGPLVNVALLPPTLLLAFWARQHAVGDLREFCVVIAVINAALLVFNLLPIYPLDGGQIFRALLWFAIGPINSLIIASLVGLVASAIGLMISLRLGLTWMAIMAGFAAWQSWIGFTRARATVQWQRLPRNPLARCPRCGAHPPAVPLWGCRSCGQAFDIHACRGICPTCGARFAGTMCAECGETAPIESWEEAALWVGRR